MFTHSELNSLRIGYIFAGTLSLLGSLFIIVCFFCIRELRRRTLMQLVFLMSVCDFMFSLKFWLPAVINQLKLDTRNNNEQIDKFCLFQAIVHQIFGLA